MSGVVDSRRTVCPYNPNTSASPPGDISQADISLREIAQPSRIYMDIASTMNPGNRLGSSFLFMRMYTQQTHQTGRIPPEIGSMHGLRDLSLAHNQLTGPIPASFGDLVRLRSLSLSCNSLSGEETHHFCDPRQMGEVSSVRCVRYICSFRKA